MSDVVEPKLKVTAAGKDTSITMIFRDEGHTLGNSLRWMLIKHPEVEFAGYTVPHPVLPEMNVRVMTRSRPALDVTDECADLLIQLSDHMIKTFDKAFENF